MGIEKTIFIEPFIGEQGWEIFSYQGFIRRLAKRFDRVIVMCRTGHDALYTDFATKIVHHDPQLENTDMWKNHGEPDNHHFDQYYAAGIPQLTVVHNDSYQTRWWDDPSWNTQQDFIRYGKCDRPKVGGVAILLHVRHTAKCNTAFRNWPRSHAQQVADALMSQGLRVACVGREGSALTLDGAIDLRDYPLSVLTDMMRQSLLLVGPQSFPAHLATLCDLPCLCWQTKLEHATRMQTRWNPFNVRVETIPAPTDNYWKDRRMWLPPVKAVLDRIDQMLDKGVKS